MSAALTIPENSYLVYAILKYKQRFEAVRQFTLESGQQEIERQKERWKAGAAPSDTPASPTLSQSEEDLHLPSGARSPLTQIPEENSAFAIGEDDSDDEGPHTPSQSSPSAQTSRRPSIASTTDETSSQLRGMSEKARGKKPAGQPSFSRQNSMTSQTSMSALFLSYSSAFTPTVSWVSFRSGTNCRPSILSIFADVFNNSSSPGFRNCLYTPFSPSSPPSRLISPMQHCKLHPAPKPVL